MTQSSGPERVDPRALAVTGSLSLDDPPTRWSPHHALAPTPTPRHPSPLPTPPLRQVLEGLNACLDHRATVYIPELGASFACPPSFRVFGCQNPLQQGGGRKGLPKSFLNRFTQAPSPPSHSPRSSPHSRL